MSIESNLRERIDTLLDDRWGLHQENVTLAGQLRSADRAYRRLESDYKALQRLNHREVQLLRIVRKVRKRAKLYQQEASRLRKQRDLWRKKARVSHEEHLRRCRARRQSKEGS